MNRPLPIQISHGCGRPCQATHTAWWPYADAGPVLPCQRSQRSGTRSLMLSLPVSLALAFSHAAKVYRSTTLSPQSFRRPRSPPTLHRHPPNLAHSSAMLPYSFPSHQRQCSSLGEHLRANAPSPWPPLPPPSLSSPWPSCLAPAPLSLSPPYSVVTRVSASCSRWPLADASHAGGLTPCHTTVNQLRHRHARGRASSASARGLILTLDLC